MSLKLLFNLVQYNEDLSRFADIWGDSVDSEDIQELSRVLWKICPLSALRGLNTCDTIAEAFDCLDSIQAEELERQKMAYNLSPMTLKTAELFARVKFSRSFGWFDDWETLGDDLINILPNIEVKNYEVPQGEDSERFAQIEARAVELLKIRLWEDLQGLEVDRVEQIRIIEAFREEYEPNLEPLECLGGEWFYFESFINCSTFGELFQGFADWCNELIFVETDINKEAIGFIYLIGGFLKCL